MSNPIETVCFKVYSILIEDGNTKEYRCGNISQFTLHAQVDTPLTVTTDKQTFVKQISENMYKIQGYIYSSKCDYALINIRGLKLSICNNTVPYKQGTVYSGIVFLHYDIWNCYEMNVCEHRYDTGLSLSGITEKIQLLTTNKNHPITLDKTSSYKDDITYPNSTSSYIITVKLCEDKILQDTLSPLQINNDLLTLKLDSIDKVKVKKIVAYIKKLCFLKSDNTK